MSESELFFYERALELAKIAENQGEVPVGAVLVFKNRIIGEGKNSPIGMNDPTSHAEIEAIRAGSKMCGNYRLTGSVLYVTLEPCIMCYADAVHARIAGICYSASDPKNGILSTGVFEKSGDFFNHKIRIESGILNDEASEMLKNFFKKRR